MNWQYIAGFFDGEGSLSHNGIGFRITIPQTNETVLNAIREYSGVGFVIKITKRQSHWKDAWTYYIANKKDVFYFLNKIVPYVIVKKELVLKVIPQLSQQIAEIEARRRLHDKRKLQAKSLREKGWSYRKIGRELRVDWGYIRRLILDMV